MINTITYIIGQQGAIISVPAITLPYDGSVAMNDDMTADGNMGTVGNFGGLTYDGTYMYSGNDVGVISKRLPQDSTVTTVASVGGYIRSMAWDGTYFYTGLDSGDINKYDSSWGSIGTIATGVSEPHGMYAKDGILYIRSLGGTLYAMNTVTGNYYTVMATTSRATGVQVFDDYIMVNDYLGLMHGVSRMLWTVSGLGSILDDMIYIESERKIFLLNKTGALSTIPLSDAVFTTATPYDGIIPPDTTTTAAGTIIPADAGGLTWDGTHLYAGNSTGAIYKRTIGDATGTLVANTGVYIRSIAWDGTYFYLGTESRLIRKYDASWNYIETVVTLSDVPHAMTYHDGYLYASYLNGQIYKIDTTTYVSTAFNTVGSVRTGIQIIGDSMLLLDYTGTITAIPFNDTYTSDTTWSLEGQTSIMDDFIYIEDEKTFYQMNKTGALYKNSIPSQFTDPL